MGTVPIPPGATIGEENGDTPQPQAKTVPIPEGATIGDAPPSAISRLGHSLLAGMGVTDDESAKRFFEHPLDTAANIFKGQGELAVKAKDAYNRGDYKGAVVHGLNYLMFGLGQQSDQAGEQLQHGDIAGGIGTMMGSAVPLIAGSPEMRGAVGDAVVQPAKNAASRALLLGRTPEEAYQSALKPRTTLTEAERAAAVQTGLQNKIPVTKDGLEKISNLIDDYNEQIKGTIASDPDRPINPAQAVKDIGKVRARFATQVNPASDLNAIDAARDEFLDQFRSQPGGEVRNMTAAEAQAMKQGTYRSLGDKAYGELKGASIEAQKALARGLKEELANQFPELQNLNSAESKLLDLQPLLERAVNRIGNHQLIGIGTPLAMNAGKAVMGSGAGAVAGLMKAVLDNPSVKSRLAIALARNGPSTEAGALARIGAFSEALGNANSPEATAALKKLLGSVQ